MMGGKPGETYRLAISVYLHRESVRYSDQIFENGVLTFYCSVVYFPKDPMELCREAVFAISNHVGYFVTP